MDATSAAKSCDNFLRLHREEECLPRTLTTFGFLCHRAQDALSGEWEGTKLSLSPLLSPYFSISTIVKQMKEAGVCGGTAETSCVEDLLNDCTNLLLKSIAPHILHTNRCWMDLYFSEVASLFERRLPARIWRHGP